MKIEAENLPPSFIRIDREGTWFYKGNEMFRKDIVKLFYQNLKRDESGKYYIELEKDLASLEVEDTAYVVTAVYKFGSRDEGNERISVLLNDETPRSSTAQVSGSEIKTFYTAPSRPTAMTPGSCGRVITKSRNFSSMTSRDGRRVYSALGLPGKIE